MRSLHRWHFLCLPRAGSQCSYHLIQDGRHGSDSFLGSRRVASRAPDRRTVYSGQPPTIPTPSSPSTASRSETSQIIVPCCSSLQQPFTSHTNEFSGMLRRSIELLGVRG